MSNRTTDKRNTLMKVAKKYNLIVEPWHPGDGITRYTFQDQQGKVLGRALGLKEAVTWLDGFVAAIDATFIDRQ